MEIKLGDKIIVNDKVWNVTSFNTDNYGDKEIWIETSDGDKDYFGGGAHQMYWMARAAYLEKVVADGFYTVIHYRNPGVDIYTEKPSENVPMFSNLITHYIFKDGKWVRE